MLSATGWRLATSLSRSLRTFPTSTDPTAAMTGMAMSAEPARRVRRDTMVSARYVAVLGVVAKEEWESAVIVGVKTMDNPWRA
jgi:hypothetical protein